MLAGAVDSENEPTVSIRMVCAFIYRMMNDTISPQINSNLYQTDYFIIFILPSQPISYQNIISIHLLQLQKMGANSEVAEESEGVSENKHEKLKKNTLRKI